MRLPEQRLWDRMRARLKGRGIRLERVENLVAVGRPDVDCLALGIFTPVELKAVDGFPVRPTTAVLTEKKGLNRDQRNWHLEWQRYGGRSLILVGVGSSDVYAFRGSLADRVNEFTSQDFSLLAAARNWDEFERLLKDPA